MRILRSDLISLWWVSWFGIFGGFLSVGCWECKRELDQAGAALPFSIGLLLFIVIAWVAFLVADSKTAKPEPPHVNLLTLMGSLNASFTLIGILFFVYIAPRVRRPAGYPDESAFCSPLMLATSRDAQAWAKPE